MRYLLLILLVSCVVTQKKQRLYPEHWWDDLSKNQLKSWEINPGSVEPPEVILSKRNELGLLSNFAATPFVFNGKTFGSMEGFWQAMKFPENSQDPRAQLANWPHTRSEVEKMSSFQAKRAGDFASKVMKRNNIIWVSFDSKKMTYKEAGRGEFYKLIRRAMEAKVNQNPSVKEVLKKTGNLLLLPDHKQGTHPPEAWQYHKIYMEIRKELKKP